MSKIRLEYIDALRGIAALYILFYHLALIPQPNLLLPQWVSRFILTGGTGVTLFFVTSAFCLCLSMRQYMQEPNPTLRFYIRRIFRIMPLFYFWVVISLIRDNFLFGASHSWREVLLNLFFGFNFVPGKNESIVWAGWTIGVEMVFYILFPLIYRYVNTWLKSVIFLLFTLFIASGFASFVNRLPLSDMQRQNFLKFSLFRHLPTFALGMVTFFIIERFIKDKILQRSWAFVLVGIAFFGYCALINGWFNFLSGSIYYQGILYSVLLVGLSIAPLWLFVNRLTCFYGKISYSVYLNHPTFVLVLIPLYRNIYAMHLPTTFQYGACVLVTLVLLTIVSYYSYHIVEQPGIRFGRKLIKQRSAV